MSLKLDVFDQKFPISTGIAGANLHRAEHGELEAEILMNEERVKITRRYGTWMITSDGTLRELLPIYAAAVQAEARKLEHREQAKRARIEAAEKAAAETKKSKQ